MQFANNAVTTLASGITAIATSMTVTSAVAFPTLTGAQYFYCTLIDAATGLIIEIVKVTAVTGSVFTIVRGQDGTTASAYLTGDKVELRLVRAELNDFPKLDEDNTFTGNITVATLIPTSSTVPTNGVYLPTANSVGFATNSTAIARFDSSGNFGLGTTPSAWNSLFKAIQVGSLASFGYDNSFGQTIVTNNAYGTGSNAYTYLYATSLQAARYEQKLGTHVWYTAPSGTAGNIVTFTQAMQIANSGGVSIGNTTDPGATNLSVTGTIASASTVTGTALIPSSSTIPTNGMYLPAANTLGFAINTTAVGQITSTGLNSIAIGATTASTGKFAGITATAGTTTVPPIQLTSGTNLTSATAGAIEYDGVNFYATTDTTNGRNVVPEYQQFYLSSNVTAFGPASGDFFGATSSASLAATTAYDIECYCYFLKTTAGTGQWIPTFSTALTVGHSYLEYTPVTGFTTTVITGAMVTAEATQQTTAVLTTTATASLTTAVSHIAKLKIRVLTNTACNFRLKFVGSAGTITPQAGSWYTVRKVASNAGNFVA